MGIRRYLLGFVCTLTLDQHSPNHEFTKIGIAYFTNGSYARSARYKESQQFVMFGPRKKNVRVDIGAVKEIVRITSIFSHPRTAPFPKGVINLRGEVTTVIDVRKRLGISATEQTTGSRITVPNAGNGQIGAIVGAVSETLTIPDDSIDPASRLEMGIDQCYIFGIARAESELVILIDLHEVLGTAAALNGAAITEHEIQPVQETFAKIEPIADAAATLFDDRLVLSWINQRRNPSAGPDGRRVWSTRRARRPDCRPG